MKQVSEDRWAPDQWRRFAKLQAFVRHRDLFRTSVATKFEEPNARLVSLRHQRVAVFASTYWEGGLVMGDHVHQLFRGVLDEYGVHIAGEDYYPPGNEYDHSELTRVIVIDLDSKTRTGCDVDIEFLIGRYNERAAYMEKFQRSFADPILYGGEEWRDEEDEFNEWLEDLCGEERELPSLDVPHPILRNEVGSMITQNEDGERTPAAHTPKPAKQNAKLKSKPVKKKMRKPKGVKA